MVLTMSSSEDNVLLSFLLDSFFAISTETVFPEIRWIHVLDFTLSNVSFSKDHGLPEVDLPPP